MLGAFEHAGGSRDRTDNLICELTLDDGAIGYGEGVARKYVTGETTPLCWKLLEASVAGLSGAFAAVTPAGALKLTEELVERIADPPGVIANATRCALELALIDALFSSLGTSPVAALADRAGRGATPERPNLTYSLVAGRGLLADVSKLRELKQRYGYRAIKAKVGFGLEQDLQNLARVRDVFGAEADLRVDANRAWDWDQAATFLDRARSLGVRTVEDPLSGDDLDQMGPQLSKLRAQTGCEVVLDEPIRTAEEARIAIAHRAVDVVSVRISKCGGLLRSAQIARLCTQHRVSLQLGCQVGESAILSAAGRRFAQSVGDLRYLEGSNERLKFSRDQDVCDEDLMYGADATAPVLSAPGLGIHVSRTRLIALSTDRLEIDF